MNDESQKRESHAARWAMWTVVALVAYVLSIGPVVALCVKIYGARPEPPKALVIVYTPLFYAVDKTPSAEPAVEAYEDWWLKVFGVTPP